MIKALSELGKFLRSEQSDNQWNHDALKPEMISVELIIGGDGSFQNFNLVENIPTMTEAITAKKGKARLLIDKAEEVLCYSNKPCKTCVWLKSKQINTVEEIICYGDEKVQKKHKLFLSKLAEYQGLAELAPVIAFYGQNKATGFEKAQAEFAVLAMTDDRKVQKKLAGNICFRVTTDGERIHEKTNILKAVIDKYEMAQNKLLSKNKRVCSVCGKGDYPVEDTPHGMIKRVPDGQTSGCALISYNEVAFLSYGLKGNLNGSVCSNCAKTYVEGLNWLLSAGNEVIIKDKKGKEKKQFRYCNRKNLGSDTVMVFWTRNNNKVEEIDQLDEPDSGEVKKMLESLTSGNKSAGNYIETDMFYSCTLSGAAARITVRDWIEISLKEFKKSIALWFRDIAIGSYDKNRERIYTVYAPLYQLARSCQRQRQKNDGSYEYDKDDTSTARVAVALWNGALKNSPVPLWILTKTLARVRLSRNGVTAERAALIKVILNRNNKGGSFMITENMAAKDRPVAYVCGQIFAKLESIQYAALGQVNSGIREKYFTYAMTSPASAFGRLFNLSSKHFTKLKSEKPGLAVNLDKELQELCKDIDIQSFPPSFQLEEQGQFAIGYYHQKQKQFANSNSKNQEGGNDNE